MRKLTLAVAMVALVAGPGLTAHAAGLEVENGAGPASASDVAGSAVVVAPGGDGLINFDHVDAPCNFIDTVALRNVGGVKFKGLTGPNDGGAILNECGKFGVSGHSSPNFLAFNCAAVLSDGGVPRVPEKIVFPTEMSSASLNVGSGDEGQPLTLVGKGSLGNETYTVTLAPALQTVSFTDPVKKIKVRAVGGPCILVIDDLTFS